VLVQDRQGLQGPWWELTVLITIFAGTPGLLCNTRQPTYLMCRSIMAL
jgi:hypothetical protein